MREKLVLEVVWHRGSELMAGLRRIFGDNGEVLIVEGLPPPRLRMRCDPDMAYTARLVV